MTREFPWNYGPGFAGVRNLMHLTAPDEAEAAILAHDCTELYVRLIEGLGPIASEYVAWLAGERTITFYCQQPIGEGDEVQG